jgi:glycerophosphoryl diester phosphodiesterase
VRVHGHRGARGARPENTLEAFAYAIGVGVHGIEMDIAATRDDVPVVSHDPWLPDGAPIRTLAWRELRRRAPAVPSLAEVLNLAPLGHFLFNIEIKSFPERPDLAPAPETFAALVLQEIDRHALHRRSMVQSFDFRILHALERLAPEIPRGALFERGEDFVAMARDAHAGIAVPEFHLVTTANVRAAHDAGLEVYTWTPNHPAEWRALMAAGVNAIITDDPAGLLQVVTSAARPAALL